MRVLAGMSAILLLSACVFASETAFFSEGEGATPFADGAQFVWREDSGEEQRVTYRRRGGGYDLLSAGDQERPLRVVFVDVPETPEQDFIAQVEIENFGDGRVYAFFWPTVAGYRVVSAPRVLDEQTLGQSTLEARCARRPNGECHLASREDLLALYQDAIYPIFVIGDVTPGDYIDQTPASGEEIGRSSK